MSVKPSNVDHDSSPLSEEETITPNLEEAEVIVEDKSLTRVELPEPDTENITVLSHKLPNKPILPWNHYDSPWQEQENPESVEKDLDEEIEAPSPMIIEGSLEEE